LVARAGKVDKGGKTERETVDRMCVGVCVCVCADLLSPQTLAAYFKAQQYSTCVSLSLPLSHSPSSVCVFVCVIDICEVSLKYQFMAQADKVPNLHLIFSIV